MNQSKVSVQTDSLFVWAAIQILECILSIADFTLNFCAHSEKLELAVAEPDAIHKVTFYLVRFDE